MFGLLKPKALRSDLHVCVATVSVWMQRINKLKQDDGWCDVWKKRGRGDLRVWTVTEFNLIF